MFKLDFNRIHIIRGDITKQEVDAIVNAANNSLLGGSGVDGAIHAAGGRQILEECMTIVRKYGELETGKAVITSGGMLNAKYVIHTVGPVWHGGDRNEKTLLANAYINSLKLASESGIKTIAFPSISTGVYGFPKELAPKIAFNNVIDTLMDDEKLEEVRFVCFDDYTYKLYADLLNNKIIKSSIYKTIISMEIIHGDWGLVKGDEISKSYLKVDNNGRIESSFFNSIDDEPLKTYEYEVSKYKIKEFITKLIKDVKIMEWDDDYSVQVSDGYQWEVTIEFADKSIKKVKGTVEPPTNGKLLQAMIYKLVKYKKKPWLF